MGYPKTIIFHITLIYSQKQETTYNWLKLTLMDLACFEKLKKKEKF